MMKRLKCIDINMQKNKSNRKLDSEIRYLSKRINSLSGRMRQLHKRIADIVSSRRHYLKYRLPGVLENEKAKIQTLKDFLNLASRLKKLKIVAFHLQGHQKQGRQRYIGIFTHVEMTRLKNLLEKYHQFDYPFMQALQRNTKYPKLKRKGLIFLTKSQKSKLKRFLEKDRR